MCGSETWTLQKSDIKRPEAFEMWIWCRMLKISWTEHKKNDEMLRAVEASRELLDTLINRQKRWLGHVLRHDSLVRTCIRGTTAREEGKRETEENVTELVTEDK